MYLRNELDKFVQTQPNNIMIDDTIMEICTCNTINIGRKNPYKLCPLCTYYDNETLIRINTMCKLKWGHNYTMTCNEEYLLAELRNTMQQKI